MTEKLLENVEIRDWSIMPAGGLTEAAVKEEERGRFLLTVQFDPHGGCLLVTVQDKDRPDFAAEAVIEVNKGVPCLHLGNQHLGDNSIHVFVTPDGVTVVGEVDHQPFQDADASRFYAAGRSRAVFYESLVQDATPAPE